MCVAAVCTYKRCYKKSCSIKKVSRLIKKKIQLFVSILAVHFNKKCMENSKEDVNVDTGAYYSIIAPFYHIRAKERTKYVTLLHCRTGQKYGLKEVRQNCRTKLNF